jgi:hypothetical protein
MAIEVVVRGVKSEDTIWTGSCGTCHSFLRAKRSDLAGVDPGRLPDGPYAKANCPVCGGTAIFHPENEQGR